MAKKGALFFLIQSMSPAEKRYFRIFSQKESAVYLRLFDAIEKQQEYNEELIRKKFRNEPFTRQLHVAKNYLSSLILRSLRNYHAAASVKAQLLALLQDAEILLARELYNHTHYVLEKAWQLADQHEYFPMQLEVLDLRRRLLLARGAGQGKNLSETIQNELRVLEVSLHLNHTWKSTSELFERIREKNFLRSAFIAKPTRYSSVRSETLRRHMRYSWHFMNGHQAKAEKEVNALLHMLRSRPEYISEEPGPYVTALGNKISMLLGEKRWKETEMLLAEMRSVPEKYKLKGNSRITLGLWLRLYNLELEYYRDASKDREAIRLVQEITGFLHKKGQAVPVMYVLLFRFQFALVYFRAGNLRFCLREINEIINGDFGINRVDIQSAARLLNLVVHFELGNILVLRYAVDSAERFLLKHKQLGEAEKELLQLFKKLSRADSKEFSRLFRNASRQLAKSGFEYFDFRQWMSKKH